MPLFKYQALKASGETTQGVISASDKKEVSALLRSQGLMPTEIVESSKKSKVKNLSGSDLLTFTILLSQMIAAGIPLYESLMTIQEQFEGESFHALLVELCEHVKAGETLSKSMSYYPKSFDSLYCSMIAAGESSGSLEIVLERLTFLLKRKAKVQKELLGALLYPAIIACFCFVVIIVMLTFVVPSMEALIGDKPANAFTSTVFSVSHFLKEDWFIYLPIIFLCAAAVIWKWSSPQAVVLRNKLMLRLPVVKTLTVVTSLARFSRTLATLLVGGVPLLDALDISQRVVTNAFLQDVIEKAKGKIAAGSTLSKELSRSKLMPQLFIRMLKIGEDSGKLNMMLGSVAEIYEDQTEKRLSQFSTLAQPVILIIMGGIVGVIMLSVLLPLTDLSSISG